MSALQVRDVRATVDEVALLSGKARLVLDQCVVCLTQEGLRRLIPTSAEAERSEVQWLLSGGGGCGSSGT